MSRPLLILVILTAIGLGSVILMPEQIRMLPSALNMHWPERCGDWVKIRDTKPSPQEIAILAKDTQFLKAEYTLANTNLQLDVGIVLGGEDPNNSIHRPERCLVAQGHGNLARSPRAIVLSNGRHLPVTRLYSRVEREVPTASGTPEMVRLNFLTYYCFVGHDTLTGSHYVRTLQDMKDRLFLGANQRWAYITVGVTMKDGPETRALASPVKGDGAPIDRAIADFLKTVIPDMIDFGKINKSGN